jgi:dephospho-CoA kinase
MIEIIGLAGSGKTTTLLNLIERYPSIISNYIISYKNLEIRLIFYLFPTLLQILYYSKSLDLVKQYVAYHIILEKIKIEPNRSCICFDQGPVFIIIKLLNDVPEISDKLYRDLSKIIVYYRHIIFLYAPNKVLMTRVRSRKQKHRAKSMSDESLDCFLSNYNKYFNDVADFIANNGIDVTWIDTDSCNINNVVNNVQKIYKQ